MTNIFTIINFNTKRITKIFNISISKVLEKFNNKIHLISDLEFFVPKDGKKIIKFIKGNL